MGKGRFRIGQGQSPFFNHLSFTQLNSNCWGAMRCLNNIFGSFKTRQPRCTSVVQVDALQEVEKAKEVQEDWASRAARRRKLARPTTKHVVKDWKFVEDRMPTKQPLQQQQETQQAPKRRGPYALRNVEHKNLNERVLVHSYDHSSHSSSTCSSADSSFSFSSRSSVYQCKKSSLKPATVHKSAIQTRSKVQPPIPCLNLKQDTQKTSEVHPQTLNSDSGVSGECSYSRSYSYNQPEEDFFRKDYSNQSIPFSEKSFETSTKEHNKGNETIWVDSSTAEEDEEIVVDSPVGTHTRFQAMAERSTKGVHTSEFCTPISPTSKGTLSLRRSTDAMDETAGKDQSMMFVQSFQEVVRRHSTLLRKSTGMELVDTSNASSPVLQKSNKQVFLEEEQVRMIIKQFAAEINQLSIQQKEKCKYNCYCCTCTEKYASPYLAEKRRDRATQMEVTEPKKPQLAIISMEPMQWKSTNSNGIHLTKSTQTNVEHIATSATARKASEKKAAYPLLKQCDVCSKRLCDNFYYRLHMLQKHKIMIAKVGKQDYKLLEYVQRLKTEEQKKITYRCEVCFSSTKSLEEFLCHNDKYSVDNLSRLTTPEEKKNRRELLSPANSSLRARYRRSGLEKSFSVNPVTSVYATSTSTPIKVIQQSTRIGTPSKWLLSSISTVVNSPDPDTTSQSPQDSLASLLKRFKSLSISDRRKAIEMKWISEEKSDEQTYFVTKKTKTPANSPALNYFDSYLSFCPSNSLVSKVRSEKTNKCGFCDMELADLNAKHIHYVQMHLEDIFKKARNNGQQDCNSTPTRMVQQVSNSSSLKNVSSHLCFLRNEHYNSSMSTLSNGQEQLNGYYSSLQSGSYNDHSSSLEDNTLYSNNPYTTEQSLVTPHASTTPSNAPKRTSEESNSATSSILFATFPSAKEVENELPYEMNQLKENPATKAYQPLRLLSFRSDESNNSDSTGQQIFRAGLITDQTSLFLNIQSEANESSLANDSWINSIHHCDDTTFGCSIARFLHQLDDWKAKEKLKLQVRNLIVNCKMCLETNKQFEPSGIENNCLKVTNFIDPYLFKAAGKIKRHQYKPTGCDFLHSLCAPIVLEEDLEKYKLEY